jgi:hypothetical protein
MDNKKYILLNNGNYACKKAEWDADSEKLAQNSNGDKFPDGVGLYIYSESGYEDGCDYAFSANGHWYMY